MSAHFVSNPRVTLNIIPRDQKVGLEDRRDLVVGQLAPAVAAKGHITFTANPSANETITLNGTVWTFKASGASGPQTNIGGSLSATLATLATNLNASADTQVVKCTYVASSDTLWIVFKTLGTSGNAFTLAASVATVSAATLAGGAAAPGSALTGLSRDIPRTDAEINELFGAASHLALMLRAYREVNAYTNVDVIALADGAGTAATSALTVSGTATAARSIYFTLVSALKHRYQIDVEIGDTPADVTAKVMAAIDDDRYLPFTYALSGTTDNVLTFTAANKGTLANTWLISLLDAFDRPAAVPGLTFTLTGWANGATNPSLTTALDPIAEIRYQGVVWPEAYGLSTIADFMDARKNVDNNVMDGTAYSWRTDTFSNLKALALQINSSETVILSNKANDQVVWKGAHIPTAGDIIAAKTAAAVSLRFETDVSISNIIVNNESLDQFGGIALASLPLFNTPILYEKRPLNGTGFAFEDQLELESNGVTVVGYNRQNNANILGQVVTTWQNDDAGNPDDTWKWLEWRHTHGTIREYFVLNVRKEFAQHRLTLGVGVPGRAIANEASIKAYLLELYDDLSLQALTVAGGGYRRLFQDRLVVTITPGSRRAQVTADVPMVSQLGVIVGTVKFNFDVA